jgi:O-phosphoseryl-tRNA(Cys) synthetase
LRLFFVYIDLFNNDYEILCHTKIRYNNYVLFTVTAFAQIKKVDCKNQKDSVLHRIVYTDVDTRPEPLIGLGNLNVQIGKSIKFSQGFEEFQGHVTVGFVVEKNGSIDGTRIVKDISKHFFADQIIKVLKRSRWKPGLCNGKPVPVLYLLPFYIGISE